MSQSFNNDKAGYARWVKARREDGFIVIIDIRPRGFPPNCTVRNTNVSPLLTV